MRRYIIIITIIITIIALGIAYMATSRCHMKQSVTELVTVKSEPEQCKPSYNINDVKHFSFSESSSLKEWEEKVFKGKVAYSIEKGETYSCVEAKSDAAASALYYKIKLDAKKRRPVLRWKWAVEKFPEKTLPENLQSEKEHDFAGRVYVVFPAMFITNYKVLEYIWAETLTVGSTGTSPYSHNIKLMVLETGAVKGDKFVSEERDIVADYVRAFGERPEHNIGAVAFMTNAEHTKTSAGAMYDEIEIGYREE